jgi:hypothetical protein
MRLHGITRHLRRATPSPPMPTGRITGGARGAITPS